MYITVNVSEYSGVVSVLVNMADGYWADNLGSQHAGSDLSTTSGHYEWGWQQQGSAVDCAGSASMLPAPLSASRIQESGGFIEVPQITGSQQHSSAPRQA